MLRKVLVVDDNALRRLALARKLDNRFDIIPATSVEEAVRVLRNRPPLAGIVSELELSPRAGGVGVLIEARRCLPDAARVLIADGPLRIDQAERIAGLDAACRLLVRPWHRGEVVTILAQAMGGRAQSPTQESDAG